MVCLKVSPDEVVEKILSLINDGFLQHVIGPALFQVCNCVQDILNYSILQILLYL